MKTIARITSILICLILLTSCAQSIDADLESSYINRKGSITSYKGVPYTGEIVKFFWETSQLEFKKNFKDGRRDGLTEWYFENGQLQEKGNYKDGEKDGEWVSYNENGELVDKENYKDGVIENPAGGVEAALPAL